MILTSRRKNGFTLIELLIAMAVSAVGLSAVFTLYNHQQKAHDTQQQIVDMQQNLRAMVDFMGRDLRIAGYDPTQASVGGIQTAAANSISFALDFTGGGADGIDNDLDGVIDEGDEDNPDGLTTAPAETITYGFKPANDADADGIADAGAAPICRGINNAAGMLDIADGIQAVGFAYAFDFDDNGRLDLSVGGNVLWAIDTDNDGFLETILDTDDNGLLDTADDTNGDGLLNDAALGSLVGLDKIRAVRVWLLARSRAPVPNYLDPRTYTVGNRQITPADAFQRRLLTAEVKCRNLGL